MRRTLAWSALLLVAGLAQVGGAGTAKGQDTTQGGEIRYSRETPITRAVRKTRNGIVTIKVTKRGSAETKESVGTGVIVDERGLVVTNYHVIKGADSLKVLLADDSTF